MKTLGRDLFFAACAVVLTAAPLCAAGGVKKGVKSPAPAAAAPARSDGQRMDGGMTNPGGPGVGPAGPDARGPRNMCGGGAWGRRGPDADAVAKMKKAEDAERKAVDLGAKYRDAAPAAQAAAKAELRAAVAELFDARLAVSEAEAAAIEKRAANLRAHLEKRKAMRDVLIDKRVEDMTGDDEDDWD
ncbi:MAG: hypothetical protein KGJ84_07135 [Elusimicrobia bacterium]|nr:hypothetical protein [Elusimicrobiota bacterium]